MRIGQGYDAHRLEKGLGLILGGVEIDYEYGLIGHSDADVLVHAVIDALLGAMGLGDIGRHFPDSDERYSGISSLMLLREVAALIEDGGYLVINIDTTIVAERPKLVSYLPRMVENIAMTLGIPENRVNIKATTEEGMGFTGEGTGISAHAICLLDS